MYADVHSRLNSFGVLKALGFSNAKLGYGVLFQVLLFLIAAAPVGILLALGVAEFVQWAAPVYLVRVLDPATLAHTVLTSAVFALAGALVPLRTVQRVDPMVAFRGT